MEKKNEKKKRDVFFYGKLCQTANTLVLTQHKFNANICSSLEIIANVQNDRGASHRRQNFAIIPSTCLYMGPDNSLARPTSRCILFDGENISFHASLVIYINSTNIPPIMIINRIYETQNLLSL
jgi:hypothetical protein